MLSISNDYNVLSSTVVAMNNFIQYIHCQAVQPFRLTLLLTKALTKIISKHIVYPCVRFSDYGSCLKFIKMRATTFLNFSCWNNFFYDCQCLIVYRWAKATSQKPRCLSSRSYSLYLQLKLIIWAQSYPWKYTERHFPAPLRHAEKQPLYWNCKKLSLQSSSLQPPKLNVDRPT